MESNIWCNFFCVFYHPFVAWLFVVRTCCPSLNDTQNAKQYLKITSIFRTWLSWQIKIIAIGFALTSAWCWSDLYTWYFVFGNVILFLFFFFLKIRLKYKKVYTLTTCHHNPCNRRVENIHENKSIYNEQICECQFCGTHAFVRSNGICPENFCIHFDLKIRTIRTIRNLCVSINLCVGLCVWIK